MLKVKTDPSQDLVQEAIQENPYAVKSVRKVNQELVINVRKVAERSEEIALRARAAERQGEAAAAKARMESDEKHLVISQDGWTYEGQGVDGLPFGFGVAYWSGKSASNGERYAGQFKGKVRVMGVFSYPPSASNSSEVARYEGNGLRRQDLLPEIGLDGE